MNDLMQLKAIYPHFVRRIFNLCGKNVTEIGSVGEISIP